MLFHYIQPNTYFSKFNDRVKFFLVKIPKRFKYITGAKNRFKL